MPAQDLAPELGSGSGARISDYKVRLLAILTRTPKKQPVCRLFFKNFGNYQFLPPNVPVGKSTAVCETILLPLVSLIVLPI